MSYKREPGEHGFAMRWNRIKRGTSGTHELKVALEAAEKALAEYREQTYPQPKPSRPTSGTL